VLKKALGANFNFLHQLGMLDFSSNELKITQNNNKRKALFFFHCSLGLVRKDMHSMRRV
jgi:hypothetical protein